MKKRNYILAVLALALSVLTPSAAFAGVWRTGAEPNESRWWYDNEDGTYAANGWQWIDGNQDGTAECYYFDSQGWMAAATETPDGYVVDENGAWTENGVVQTRTERLQDPETGDGASLVVYFSRTGTTRRAAREIGRLTGAPLVELEAAEPYPDSYEATLSRARRELNAGARPALAGEIENWESYDTVYVGYPIWCGTAPMPVFTFLETYDFSGKTVIPFCTSGSSGIGMSQSDIEAACPEAAVLQGIRANDVQVIEPWLEQLGVYGSGA